MGGTTARQKRSRVELAEFLRTRRSELQPEDVGIERGGRRRVNGLRRHEVADLAAVSVTLYTWLEQGRGIGVSAQALDSVSRALQLDEDGARYVRRLAGAPVDTSPSPAQAAQFPDDLHDLVDDLLPSPAYLTTAPFDLIAWNQAFARLFVDPLTLPPHRRNGLALLFTEELMTRLVGWDTELDDNIARFRSASGKYPDEPRFQEITEDLLETEPTFGPVWRRREARRFHGRVQELKHHRVGLVKLHMLELRVIEHPGVTLVVHRAADAESRTRLRELTCR